MAWLLTDLKVRTILLVSIGCNKFEIGQLTNFQRVVMFLAGSWYQQGELARVSSTTYCVMF